MNNKSQIFDTDCLEEIFDHLTDDALVLFDLDNTLIEPLQHFGSVQWAEYYAKKLLATGKTFAESCRHIQSLWNELYSDIPMRLIDESAPEFIRQFRSKGHCVMGLTARCHEDSSCTLPVLEQFGIQFDRPFEDFALDLEHPARFEKGILYASELNPKSAALMALLEKTNYMPKKVIFVDDKHHHVKDLEHPLTARNVEYVGIRYSKADKRVQEFDPRIADLQMELFPRFVSDEEALKLLR